MTSSTTVRPPSRAERGRSRIDPRIAARRDEVERVRSRKLRRRLLMVLAVLALVAGALGLTRTPLLDVDEVTVEGNEVVSTTDVVAATGIHRGDRMTGVDPDTAATRVRALPWVRTASVSREWPGAVRVTVTERRPVAVVASRTGEVVVDASGRVLGPATAEHAGLVRLGGEADAEAGEGLGPAWQPLLTMAARLPEALRTSVATIGTVEDGRAGGSVITLTTGTVVDLCDVSDLDAKLGALVALVQRADPATAATIDLCVPGSPALTRKAGGA